MRFDANSRMGMADWWLRGSISQSPLWKEKRSVLTGCDSLLLLSESSARLCELCSAVVPPTVPTVSVVSDAQSWAACTSHLTRSIALHCSTPSLLLHLISGKLMMVVVALLHTKQPVYLAGQMWQNSLGYIPFSVCTTYINCITGVITSHRRLIQSCRLLSLSCFISMYIHYRFYSNSLLQLGPYGRSLQF